MLLSALFCYVPTSVVSAKQVYGYELNDSLIQAKTTTLNNQYFNNNVFLKGKTKAVYEIQKTHHFKNLTPSFYLVITLLLLLGILKTAFPMYFNSLYKALTNSGAHNRHIKDQTQFDSAANFAMNIFFCIAIGFYLFAVIMYKTDDFFIFKYPPYIILCILILLLLLTYLTKFLILKFLGWTFRIQDVTDTYSFNVLLINKILGIVLLPFSIILIFGQGPWLDVVFILSIVVLTVLVLNRYIRSWSSLGSFFQYSKFHFFTYFCASELLPFAILVKIATKWLI